MSEVSRDDDEIDDAYRKAAQMVSEGEAGREERRRRVLAAVAADRAPPRRARGSRWAGAWLAAASVAGLGLVIVAGIETRGDDEEVGQRVAAAPAAVAPAAVPPQAATVEGASRMDGTAGANEAATPPKRALPQRSGGLGSAVQEGVQPQQERLASAFPANPAETTSGVASAAGVQEGRAAAAQADSAASPASSGDVVAAAPSAMAKSESRAAAPTARMRAEAGAAANEMAAKRSVARAEGRMTAEMSEAISEGRADIVGSLLDQGQALESRDAVGDTPLLRAVRSGKADVAAVLVRRGADRGARGTDGRSAEDLGRASQDTSMHRVFDK